MFSAVKSNQGLVCPQKGAESRNSFYVDKTHCGDRGLWTPNPYTARFGQFTTLNNVPIIQTSCTGTCLGSAVAWKIRRIYFHLRWPTTSGSSAVTSGRLDNFSHCKFDSTKHDFFLICRCCYFILKATFMNQFKGACQ
jgi:hypothetical protein